MKQQNPRTRIKEIYESQKQIYTAPSRKIQTNEILKFDSASENGLFEDNYTIKPKQNHILLIELEN